MATRKSSAAAAARRTAMERAARFKEREEQLVSLAVAHATAQADLDSVAERYDEQVARLRAEQADAERDARERVGRAVVDMVNLGVSKDEAAERLGITRAAVNSVMRSATPTSDEPTPASTGEDDEQA